MCIEFLKEEVVLHILPPIVAAGIGYTMCESDGEKTGLGLYVQHTKRKQDTLSK